MTLEAVVTLTHPNQIYSLSIAKHWILTGSLDGFLRLFDVSNTKLLLQSQRQQLPISSLISSANILRAWENIDSTANSPIHSVVMHSQAIFCCVGCQSGNINLYTTRHHLTELQYTFKGHKGPVSALLLSRDEKILYSGSWDCMVKFWSLDTGLSMEEFKLTSHITSMSLSSHKIPLLLITTYDGTIWIYDIPKARCIKKILASESQSPPWALMACWNFDSTKIYVGRRDERVTVIEYGKFTLSSIQLPLGSGPVSAVGSIDKRYLVIGSYDNIRQWDLDFVMTEDEESTPVPFAVIPGHHGSIISSLVINKDFLLTASGNCGYEGSANGLCFLYPILKDIDSIMA